MSRVNIGEPSGATAICGHSVDDIRRHMQISGCAAPQDASRLSFPDALYSNYFIT
jgi:hypothetical protein